MIWENKGARWFHQYSSTCLTNIHQNILASTNKPHFIATLGQCTLSLSLECFLNEFLLNLSISWLHSFVWGYKTWKNSIFQKSSKSNYYVAMLIFYMSQIVCYSIFMYYFLRIAIVLLFLFWIKLVLIYSHGVVREFQISDFELLPILRMEKWCNVGKEQTGNIVAKVNF